MSDEKRQAELAWEFKSMADEAQAVFHAGDTGAFGEIPWDIALRAFAFFIADLRLRVAKLERQAEETKTQRGALGRELFSAQPACPTSERVEVRLDAGPLGAVQYAYWKHPAGTVERWQRIEEATRELSRMMDTNRPQEGRWAAQLLEVQRAYKGVK